MLIFVSIRDDVLRRDFRFAVSTVYLPALGPDLCRAGNTSGLQQVKDTFGNLGEDLPNLKGVKAI